jgi:hypothetical protein
MAERIGSLFDENETAQVIRAFRAMDPSFDMESFSRELREYIVPEVVDAYLSADKEALQMWCGEAVGFDHICLCMSAERSFRLTTYSGPRWSSIPGKVSSANPGSSISSMSRLVMPFQVSL